VGTSLSTFVLSPSCPDEFAPQQYTAPVVSSAQVWLSPAATAETAAGSGMTVGCQLPELGPAWPKLLRVQFPVCGGVTGAIPIGYEI